ncbi:MAG: hypothetical protein L0387_45150 [Acidobacteria bacterium]|nr:hypothetical protein [Acidobacteriota bacterium]MCI0718611.1 hypothetical protein [Acidobacteriota bacterium]
MMPISRRGVIHGLASAALCSATRTLASPLLIGRDEAEVTPGLMKFRPEIEPLVALVERTPRDRCADMVVDQLRQGVSYRQFLAALFLAGIRNVNPRPPGFALHCVFVIHSAHIISLEAPADSRLLPLFYALDNFKAAQERDARQPSGDYTMRPLGGSLPALERAAAEFTAAMEAWDPERAERAAVSLARHRSAGEVFEMLWRYGARDYRNIGHKAIFVANAHRTVNAIGWQHAEPVLRSLVLGLLDFGKQQHVNGYAFDDQCYGGNLRRLKETFARLDDSWIAEQGDPLATRSILGAIREATAEEACAEVAGRFTKGKTSAGSVWDAVHLAAAELRMRARSGAAIVGVHAVTAVNALHHAYLVISEPQDRLLFLLQAVGWMGQFRKWAETREENLRRFPITDMEPSADTAQLAETFAGIPSNLDASAARVLRLARDLPARQAFLATALRLTLAKADEVHYYKYLAALIEDVPLLSPDWQPYFLAATVYYVKGSNDPEPTPMKRAREALRTLAV